MSSAGHFRTSDDVAESNSAHVPNKLDEIETERPAENPISIEEVTLEDPDATTKPKFKRTGKGKLQDEDGKRGGYRKYSYEQLEQAMDALRTGRLSLCDAEKTYNVPKATLFGRMRRANAERMSCTLLSKDEFGALDEVRSAVLAMEDCDREVLRIAFRSRSGRSAYDSDSASDNNENKEVSDKPDDEWIHLELHSVSRCETDTRREREEHANAFSTLVHAGFDELVSLVRGRIAIRCASLDEIETILNAYQRRSPFRFVRSRIDRHAAQFGALPAHSELLAKNAVQFRSRTGAQNVMEFDGVPFVKVAERRFVCEHSRRPESKQLRTDEQTGEQPVSECDVNVCILQIVRFPQYRVLTDTNRGRLFCSSLLLRDFVDQRANVVLDCHYLVFLPSIVEHCHVHNYDLTSATFVASHSQLLTVREDAQAVVEAEVDQEAVEAAAVSTRLGVMDADADTQLGPLETPKPTGSALRRAIVRSGLQRRTVPLSASAAQASRKRAARFGRPAFDFKFPSLVVPPQPGRKAARRRSAPANCRVVSCIFELIRACVLEQGLRDTTVIQSQIREWWMTRCGVVPVESDWSRRPPVAVLQHQVERVLRGCTAPMSDVEEAEPETVAELEQAEDADVDVDVDAEGMTLGVELKQETVGDGQIVFADEHDKAQETYEYAFEPDADVDADYALMEPTSQAKAKRGRAAPQRSFAARRRGAAAQQRVPLRKRVQNGLEVDEAVRTISLDQPDVTIVDLDDVAEWVQLA